MNHKFIGQINDLRIATEKIWIFEIDFRYLFDTSKIFLCIKSFSPTHWERVWNEILNLVKLRFIEPFMVKFGRMAHINSLNHLISFVTHDVYEWSDEDKRVCFSSFDIMAEIIDAPAFIYNVIVYLLQPLQNNYWYVSYF